MYRGGMTIDVFLVSTPNKNIDYPGLSLPILTSSLRNKGFDVLQIDYNVILRDKILTAKGLTDLSENMLPSMVPVFLHSGFHLSKLGELQDYLVCLNDYYQFTYLEEVKLKVQERNFAWVFSEEKRFKAYLDLFKVNRALHYIIDAAIAESDILPDCYVLALIQNIFIDLENKITAECPAIVGFSILDIQRGFTFALIKKIRSTFGGTIAVGGPDPTRFPKEYIKLCSDIDILFTGESEESFPLLLQAIKSERQSLESIPGIYYRNQKGGLVVNESTGVDFSATPTPDFNGLPLEKYLTPALPLQVSRGCYWGKCNFCIHYDTYGSYQKRNIDKVIEDIKTTINKHNTKYFHFTDDCISVSLADQLTEAILSNNINIRWLSYFRLEKGLNKDRLSMIYQAGGRVLEFGLESASEKVLHLMNKTIFLNSAAKVIDDASAIGFLVKLFMFHGYPGENLEDLLKTINFTEQRILNRKVRAFFPLRNRFELLKGSEIYDRCRSKKESHVKKIWEPSGLFGIRSEYLSDIDEGKTMMAISMFVENIREYMKKEHIYNTDDENVMLDLLVLDYKNDISKWGCI